MNWWQSVKTWWANRVGSAPAPKSANALVVDLPPELAGTLMSGVRGRIELDADEQRDFAVLQRVDRVTLVVSQTVNNTSSMFNMRRRVKDAFQDHEVILVVADPREIAELYRQYDVSAIVRRRTRGLGAGAEPTRPEQLIEEMVAAADRLKTSDIHMESFLNSGRVLFRVNGRREVWRELSHEDLLSMGQVMYGFYADAQSKDPTWNPMAVTECSLEWTTSTTVEQEQYQLRFSSSPIHPGGGFQIVLRMLKLTAGGGIQLNQVGYSESQLEQIVAMTTSRKGLVLLCGATNSGKSTSIQAILKGVFDARGRYIKLITVEDPVEYVIEGACQIPVARKRKGDDESFFEKALRGTLRQDPDFVMVGEIRDKTSAETTQDLGLAGRKLMATLHTNSAMGAFVRLHKIGLPLDVTCMPDFMSGLVYQSLVPTLCPNCSVPWEQADKSSFQPAFIRRVLGVADVSKLRLLGKGCDRCRNTGYVGRTVCAEVVVPDREMCRLLLEYGGNPIEAERYWLENGGRRIIDHAIDKMLTGALSPVDVEANIENFSG